MIKISSTMSQQIAEAAQAFELKRTGHKPHAVSVVMTDNTLVITLHGALSEAEKAVAKDPSGAAKIQEFHKQLFANSSEWLKQEIKRITGITVQETAAEVEPQSGTLVQAFTTGTMVQVFLLTGNLPTESWSSIASTKPL